MCSGSRINWMKNMTSISGLYQSWTWVHFWWLISNPIHKLQYLQLNRTQLYRTLDRRPSHCCACHFDGHHLPDDRSALPHLWLGTHCHLPYYTATLFLLSNPDLKLICFLPLSANYSTYLFRQRLCSRLTALWRYINFILLLLLLEGCVGNFAWFVDPGNM